MKQEAHWLKTMGSSPMIRWKKGQNIVTAQTVSEHFAVSYISVTIFTRLRLTLYRELNIINLIYCAFWGSTEGIWRKNEKKP